MENRSRSFLIILVSLLILSVFFGIWYFSHDWKAGDNYEKFATEPPQHKAPPALKIYRNDELGFEFSYPEDVPVKEDDHGPYLLFYMSIGGGMLNPYYFAVEKTDETDIQLLDKHFFRRKIESIGPRIREERYRKFPSIGLARITTFEKNPSLGSTENIYVQFIHEGKLFSFLIWKNPDSNKIDWNIYDSMLSSFKFLK